MTRPSPDMLAAWLNLADEINAIVNVDTDPSNKLDDLLEKSEQAARGLRRLVNYVLSNTKSPHEMLLKDLATTAMKLIRLEYGEAPLDSVDTDRFDSDRARHYWLRLEAMARPFAAADEGVRPHRSPPLPSVAEETP